MKVIFFKTIPRKAIWGGTLIKEYFHYPWFPDSTGQSWAFSAQKEASNVVSRGELRGKTLLELWEDHSELFQSYYDKFPFIISLVAPMEDLSIQVHPDKEHAEKIGYLTGKNEAWYFIDAKEESNIVYGHSAADENELREYIARDKWEDFIDHLEVKTGDFVYIPAGKLHALRKGNIVYEIQQSTDITYRFYDYHRKDIKGEERELHLEQAISCLAYSKQSRELPGYPKIQEIENSRITCFWKDDSFCVAKIEIKGEVKLSFRNYQLATVVRGFGVVDGEQIVIGDSFLIPYYMRELIFDGDMDIMMTSEEF
ncbi:MAG: type I phosphomannose isomerase catalytic subunit [Mobilitalea sp.]